MTEAEINNKFAISLAAPILAIAAFCGGYQWHRYESRPPIVNGVQTRYERGRPGVADAAIVHQVYPPSGEKWFETHTLNGADDCKLCKGEFRSSERYDVYPEDRPTENKP